MAKRRKSKVKEKDLISALPDEVLSLIVSHLPLREAVQTSILSKRWRHAWKLVSKLEFDAVNIARRASDFRKLIKHNQDKFVKLVNQVLELDQSGRIGSFRLQCRLGPEYSDQIDRWLQLAVNRTLQNLDIDTYYSFGYHPTPSKNCYRIPNWIFDGRLLFLKHLSLAHCSLELLPSAACFSSLESFTLASTHLSQDNINIILFGCPNLQRVSLLRCVCPSHLELVSRNQFLTLKHLVIVDCDYLTGLSIFNAVGLVSFECLGTGLSLLSLQNTAKPVHVYLDVAFPDFVVPWRNFDRLATDFPKLEKLMLCLPRLEFEGDPLLQCLERLPTFDRLQELVLDCSFQFLPYVFKIVSSWMKASPHLQKLQIIQPSYRNVGFDKYAWFLYKKSENDGENSCHENLREVTLYHFDGKLSERALVRYLLKYAPALESIKIYFNSHIYVGNSRWVKLPTRFMTRKKLYRRIRKAVSNVGYTNAWLQVF